jgi:hypothetical protein
MLLASPSVTGPSGTGAGPSQAQGEYSEAVFIWLA